MNRNELLKEMLDITNWSIQEAKKLQQFDLTQLNYKKNAESWSVLECIEHLNLYGDYYLPLMEKAVFGAEKSNVTRFKPGWLGNYFANAMKGKNGKIKKMKSPKDKDPRQSQLNALTINRFIKQQELLKSLLENSGELDLNKIKIPISIAKWIKLKLGDTYRFYVYHIERHLHQANRIHA
jgi:hypothetical protein